MQENNKRRFGAQGEAIACQFLRENGYVIKERNFRVGKLGEIDIIAKEGHYWCFIEVKTRTGNAFGSPSEAVGYKKQETIRMLAQIYMMRHSVVEAAIRFDIVEVVLKKSGPGFEIVDINLIQNAF